MKMDVCTRCHRVLSLADEGHIRGRLKCGGSESNARTWRRKIDWCKDCSELFEVWAAGGRR